jgi:pyroglutamyl-peptidase
MGFGPFQGIDDNPASRLAEASDAASGTWRVVGRTMPVSYRRAVEETARWVARSQPDVVLGVGVAVRRTRPALERWGRGCFNPRQPDVDGRLPAWGAVRRSVARASRLPVEEMARSAGIAVSEDCGTYVCNGWLFTCLVAFPESLPLGFLHIPDTGWSVSGLLRLLDGFSRSQGMHDG